MNAPDFSSPFDIAYDQLSIHKDWLTIPSWCNVFDPENNDEFECLAIIQPAPERGSRAWTMNGQRILIGVFRDEGRKTKQQDLRVAQWARYGTRLIVGTDRPHFMKPGDEVTLWNVNVPTMIAEVAAIHSMTEFEVRTSITGGTSGIEGSYQPVKPVNFYEDFIVFRLIPSMKLITWPMVQAILNAGFDQQIKPPVHLVDVNTGAERLVAAALNNKATNLLPNGGTFANLRNRQQLDEEGNPIIGVYNNLGQLVESKFRYSIHRNAVKMVNPVMVNEDCSCDDSTNEKLYVFDYYGFDLNDETRAPYASTQNVYYDYHKPNGLTVRNDNTGELFYRGIIQDEFGNVVIGARADNSLITRQAILPIQVDQFNVPYKAPRKIIV